MRQDSFPWLAAFIPLSAISCILKVEMTCFRDILSGTICTTQKLLDKYLSYASFLVLMFTLRLVRNRIIMYCV